MRITVPVAAFAVLVVAFGSRMTGGSSLPAGSTLVFVSEFGEPIGQGKTRSFDAVAASHANSNAVRILASDPVGGSPGYELMLRAPDGQKLRPGEYVVDGTPGPDEPGMHFRGDGRSCNRIEGRFEIEAVTFGSDATVEHLRAKLEQRCNGTSATLWSDVTVHHPDTM